MPARQPDRVAKARHYPALAARPAMRSWLRISFDTAAAISGVMPRASLREHGGVGRIGQQPVAERRRPSATATGANACGVMGIDDQAGDLVVLVRDHGFVEELLAAAGRQAPSAPRSFPRRCRPQCRQAGRPSAAASPWPEDRAGHRRRKWWRRSLGDRPWWLPTASRRCAMAVAETSSSKYLMQPGRWRGI